MTERCAILRDERATAKRRSRNDAGQVFLPARQRHWSNLKQVCCNLMQHLAALVAMKYGIQSRVVSPKRLIAELKIVKLFIEPTAKVGDANVLKLYLSSRDFPSVMWQVYDFADRRSCCRQNHG